MCRVEFCLKVYVMFSRKHIQTLQQTMHFLTHEAFVKLIFDNLAFGLLYIIVFFFSSLLYFYPLPHATTTNYHCMEFHKRTVLTQFRLQMYPKSGFDMHT